ncbi:MAG: excinuclease ABC subunit C [Bacteroidetes bacterium]|nr:excinuclease ABC subunit C [Bacteroidota bacterium]
MSHYYVYIMSNKSRTLYIGYTNDLYRRVLEHKRRVVAGFTSKYNINRLLYWESYETMQTAIKRETRLKGWARAKKIALIEAMNPGWQDLSGDWEKEKNLTNAIISTRQRPLNKNVEGLLIAREFMSRGKN